VAIGEGQGAAPATRPSSTGGWPDAPYGFDKHFRAVPAKRGEKGQSWRFGTASEAVAPRLLIVLCR